MNKLWEKFQKMAGLRGGRIKVCDGSPPSPPSLPPPLPFSLTDSLTHSLTPSLAHSLTRSLACSPNKVPKIYLRTLVELEEGLASVLGNKEMRKKMSTTNSKVTTLPPPLRSLPPSLPFSLTDSLTRSLTRSRTRRR